MLNLKSVSLSLSLSLIVILFLGDDLLFTNMSMLAIAGVKLLVASLLAIPLKPVVDEYFSNFFDVVLK